MSGLGVYAEPKLVTSVDDCIFYHTMEVPGHGLIKGFWDLRPKVRQYLGGVELRGKRVLEVGTASGYLCMHMEHEGAEVVAFDLSEDEDADVVPFARHDIARRALDHKDFMQKIRNGFWLNHRAHHSKARAVYGTAYRIPAAIGPVDVSIFGAILMHLRDPLLALQNALRLTRETVIITEPIGRGRGIPKAFVRQRLLRNAMNFQPRVKPESPATTWWALSPGLLERFLGVLGFEDVRVKYHFQHQEGVGRVLFFTVIGRRTVPFGVA